MAQAPETQKGMFPREGNNIEGGRVDALRIIGRTNQGESHGALTLSD